MPPETDDLPLFSKVPGDQAREIEGLTRLRPGTSLSAAIRVWAEELERAGRSEHTVKAFSGDLRLLAKFVGPGQGIGAIGTHDLKNFLEWMVDRRGVPCSPKTYSRRVTSIKAFFRWLSESGVLNADPAAAVPQQTVLSPLPDVLTRSEVERVLEAADAARKGPSPDARPYTLLALLLETGIKKGECLSIHPNHVHLNAAEGPILFVRYGDPRKRYKERKLRLSSTWISAYREYLTQYEPRERLLPWSPRRLEYLLEELGQTAGLEKHLSFDMCRWTAALTDYQAGAERDAIRQKLGISKIQWREVGTKLDRLAAKVK
ncbi:MAG TPA: tyrosine-type recombinase/integrase [Anaerolineales bacterium]|nr:tyrosine-type recombinase/integrase [Anaerolineales bacterium]